MQVDYLHEKLLNKNELQILTTLPGISYYTISHFAQEKQIVKYQGKTLQF